MKSKFLLVSMVVLSALAFASTALAHDGQRGSKPNHGCGEGTLVVNVKYKVANDLDTTTPIAGVQYDWAVDNYNRRVLVYQTGANTFCAVTMSRGTFTTLAGHSPAGTGMIPAGITGKFMGGYVTNEFHGTLLATPLSSKTGDLGTKDFACVASADHNDATKSCPGTFDWFSQYFTADSGADWALAKYAFIYHAKGHGTWIDKLSGGTIRMHGDIRANARAAKKVEDRQSTRHTEGQGCNHDDHNDDD
jgi:hypothetical protein